MEEIIRNKWPEILDYMQKEFEIASVGFRTWLQPLEIASVDEDNNKITLCVDENQVGPTGKDHIQRRYSVCLSVSIESVTGYHLELDFKTKKELNISAPVEFTPKTVKQDNQPTLLNLNEKYTFDTFVVGNNNSLAHAAALAVAESPLQSGYNPLYIYGGSGLGKTHLMHSIAHYILENSPDLNILYVTSEQYTNEIIDAMRNSKQDRSILTNMKKKYREVDVLMVDDIQFIIGKDITQEEFFHTFNALFDQGKQIILTSDKHPNQIEKLDERYRSRFNWGLPIDIQSPEYETRLAILRKKNDSEGNILKDEILQYIAENIKTNIRDLEGAYNKLIFRSRLLHKDLDFETAMDTVKDLILTDEKSTITNDYIINIVVEHYNMSLEQICSKNRSQNIANVRQICMYLCRRFTNSSFDEIGSKLGNRDRTTVMHGCNKIEEDLKTNTSLQTEIDILNKIINHT